MAVETPPRMDADAFLAWAVARGDAARHELAGGEVVAMPPERAGHARMKFALARALEDAVARTGRPCEVFTDGMAVRIDSANVFVPDGSLRCGPRLSDDTIDFSDPVVVAEVLSPSTQAQDTGGKLEAYFRLESLAHYLIVKTDPPAVIHHAREAGGIRTTIRREGDLSLDPPGVALSLDAVFRRG